MDVTTYALVGVVVVLAIVVAVAARRRRDRSLDPVRLGPAWTPSGTAAASSRATTALRAAEVLGDDPRVGQLQERTGLDAESVATVLIAWDELLSVLGYLALPADHRYWVYDPYDPPVASRGPDNRPVADPVRVARDVDRRTRVSEADARAVLDALLEDPPRRAADEPPGHADGHAGDESWQDQRS